MKTHHGGVIARPRPKAACSTRSISHWSTTRLRLCFVAHCTGKHACPEENENENETETKKRQRRDEEEVRNRGDRSQKRKVC